MQVRSFSKVSTSKTLLTLSNVIIYDFHGDTSYNSDYGYSANISLTIDNNTIRPSDGNHSFFLKNINSSIYGYSYDNNNTNNYSLQTPIYVNSLTIKSEIYGNAGLYCNCSIIYKQL